MKRQCHEEESAAPPWPVQPRSHNATNESSHHPMDNCTNCDVTALRCCYGRARAVCPHVCTNTHTGTQQCAFHDDTLCQQSMVKQKEINFSFTPNKSMYCVFILTYNTLCNIFVSFGEENTTNARKNTAQPALVNNSPSPSFE